MYIGASTNTSPVIASKAAAAIATGGMKAVTLSANGIEIATAGAAAFGILIAETDVPLNKGDTATVQIKDIGLWTAGAAVAVGDELASDADGAAVKATAGDFILGVALEEATAAGQIIKVQITKAGYKPTA